ncbi:MAG TPA: hypothetical protein VMB03_32690 [Bryobacteraceae bacterium]|nr:hypothetical protein [Bryobacteraceae bacterium]
MKAALRVLTALSEHKDPNQADIDELHWYAPADRERPIDEVVCDAIQRALKDREQSRRAAKANQRRRSLAMNPAELEGIVETAVVTSRKERDREVERLLRENARHQQEYRNVCTRLKRLGIVLQHATPSLLAADTGDPSETSEAARSMLGSVSNEIDVSGIIQLLNDHLRITKALLNIQEALKAYGIQQ